MLFLAGGPLRRLYRHTPDTSHMHDGTPTPSGGVLAEIDFHRMGAFKRRSLGLP